MVVLSTLLLGFAASALAVPTPIEERASTPTVYLVGDSTMAELGGGTGTQGWGHYLQYSLSTPVVNRAIAGRSARSYTVEGRFTSLLALVQPSDIVIIEFGHNDGGTLGSTDNGRTDCPGAGNETCASTYNGQSVTVLTYPAYLQNAGKALVDKGARVVFSSPTPNNPWEGGKFSYGAGRFTGYSEAVARAVGSEASFVDHGTYTADVFKTLGSTTVDGFFPKDHTHTSPAGADAVAGAFVKGVLCSKDPFLSGFVKNATASVAGSCV